MCAIWSSEITQPWQPSKQLLKVALHSKARQFVYVDMDHTLCDFNTSYHRYRKCYPDNPYPHSIVGFFEGLAPIEDAIATYRWLHEHPQLAVFVLTAPSVMNPHCYIEKRLWIEKHQGMDVVRRLIISPHKGLNKGDYLIDDRASGQGQDEFEGALIQFGSEAFPDWQSVREFFDTVLDACY